MKEPITTIHGLVHNIIVLSEKFQTRIDEVDADLLKQEVKSFITNVQNELTRISKELNKSNLLDTNTEDKSSFKKTGDSNKVPQSRKD